MTEPLKSDPGSGPAQPPAAQASAARRGSRGRQTRDVLLLYLAVASGTVVGGLLRALVSIASIAFLGHGFPIGTLLANVAGSFVIGFYATLTGPDGRVFAGPRTRHFVMTGFCGGFTTFSIFSLETMQLARQSSLPAAALNVGISILAWLAAVWLGYLLASRLNRLKGS